MPQPLGEGGSTCGEGGLGAVGAAGKLLCVWNVLFDEGSHMRPGGAAATQRVVCARLLPGV